MPNRLTPLQVKRATEGTLPDGNGLLLRVGKGLEGGGKSWVFRYKVPGKTREMGLGGADIVTLAEARGRATECRKLLLDGIDRLQRRREQLLARKMAAACVPNMGRPSGVEAWADEWHLHEITDSIPLQVFVGEGADGKAWAVPAKYGSFALSIRGTTRACAVWARAADPGEVEADFHKLIDGSKRPGLNLTVVEDKVSSSPAGQVHELVYQMSAADAPTGFLFTLITAESPGGAFQASLQVAAAQMPSPTN